MLYKLTIDEIRTRSTNQSFVRGENYYKNNAIFDMVQRDNQIEGFCEASSQPAPYFVRAILSNQGILETSCACQYDLGGDCKHIIALLLTYLNKPEIFDQRLSIADTLASRDKNELIVLIRKMIERYPDLQALVDLPIPGKTKRQMPIDVSAFRKQMRYALRNYGGWGDRTADFAISSIREIAGEFAEKNDWISASAIYRTILEECTATEDEYPITEDEGEFGSAVNETIEKLAACLEQPIVVNDDLERQSILEVLLSVYIWDIDLGGYGIGDEAPTYILRYARPSDIPALREKIVAAQKRKSATSYGKWGVQAYSTFLAELDTLDNVDPEVTLARLREEGMYALLVRKLIELNRIDEAVKIVEHEFEVPFEQLAQLPHLVAAGRGDDAIRIAEKNLTAQYDSHTAVWLLEQYKAREDWQAYLKLQQQEMQKSPSERHYILIKQASEKIGNWQTIYPVILQQLKQKQQFDILTKIYLYEHEWDAAWDILEKHISKKNSSWSYLHLDLDVAQKSKTEHPHKAIPVFIKYARYHISQRQRQYYQTAAELLSTVRELYLQLDDTVAWQSLIAGIRAEFPTLRALHDELKKARL